MNTQLQVNDINESRCSLLERALSAFDRGDVDLARRILLASYHHHTRKELTVSERLNLWWCLVWFAFYEGCPEKGEKVIRQIISLEENLIERRETKIAFAKYVLFIFCSQQAKNAEAKKQANDAADIFRSSQISFQTKSIILAELARKNVPEVEPENSAPFAA